MNNIPRVKFGIIAVSRDCFPIALSTQRKKNIVAAYGKTLFEVFKYLGVQDIAYNQPRNMPYATKNPWG